MAYVLKHCNGGHFSRMTNAGPMMVRLRDAATFATRDEAAFALGQHWAMGSCRIVKKPARKRAKKGKR
jgi:hypothetical protein